MRSNQIVTVVAALLLTLVAFCVPAGASVVHLWVDSGDEAIIPLNDDDDDTNDKDDQKDGDDGDSVAGENDTAYLDTETEGENEGSSFTLSATSGGSKVRIWKNTTYGCLGAAGDVISLPETWDCEEFPGGFWVEGVAVSDSVGDITLRLAWNDTEPACTPDTVTITVIDLELDIDGVTDADETKTGGWVAVNDDDDDDSDVLDYNEGDTAKVDGEDDLVSISLSRSTTVNAGSVTLSAESGGSRIRVWKHSTRCDDNAGDNPDLVALPKTWSLASESLPEHLYVEGIETSGSVRDVVLKLEWTGAGATSNPVDKIKLTVVNADLRVDADNDSSTAQRPPAGSGAERTEEEVAECGGTNNPTGLIVPLNRDYDEGSGTDEDYANSGIVTNDPDLVQASLVMSLPAALVAQAQVQLTYDAGTIKVYKNTTLVTTGAKYDLSTFGTTNTLLIEGIAPSSSTGDDSIAVALFVDDEEVATDNVTLTVVKIDLRPHKWSYTGDILSDKDEDNPGLYSHVNWNDDDGDGWTDNGAPPNATYTADKDDDHIWDTTDNDFQDLDPLIEPTDLPGKVKVTFTDKFKLYTSLSKKKLEGANWVPAEVASGAEVNANAMAVNWYYLFLEGQSGSASFRDVEATIQYRLNNQDVLRITDHVKVTVFEVTSLTGLFGFGSQSAECDKKFSYWYRSDDKCGKISWDDADGDGQKTGPDNCCVYFANCMECRGTVRPTGVTTEAEFHWLRDRWGRVWRKVGAGNWTPVSDNTPWEADDHAYHGDEDNTPSTATGNIDHIFHLDGPGFTQKAITAH